MNWFPVRCFFFAYFSSFQSRHSCDRSGMFVRAITKADRRSKDDVVVISRIFALSSIKKNKKTRHLKKMKFLGPSYCVSFKSFAVFQTHRLYSWVVFGCRFWNASEWTTWCRTCRPCTATTSACRTARRSCSTSARPPADTPTTACTSTGCAVPKRSLPALQCVP